MSLPVHSDPLPWRSKPSAPLSPFPPSPPSAHHSSPLLLKSLLSRSSSLSPSLLKVATCSRNLSPCTPKTPISSTETSNASPVKTASEKPSRFLTIWSSVASRSTPLLSPHSSYPAPIGNFLLSAVRSMCMSGSMASSRMSSYLESWFICTPLVGPSTRHSSYLPRLKLKTSIPGMR